jgi:hypothetical protein
MDHSEDRSQDSEQRQGAADSSSIDHDTHAFVVKLWKEEPALWRGHVTHAYTGQRRYFQDLEKILVFIRSFLQ